MAREEPHKLGLPLKYREWRPSQEEALDFILDNDRKFTALNLPTGSGKTAIAVGAGIESQSKYVILTATKGLQDQYDEFPTLVDIRGMDNYGCVAGRGTARVRNWTCKAGEELGCPRTGSVGCTYFDSIRSARLSRSIKTNYQFWMHSRKNSQGSLESPTDPIKMLILDEAHSARDQLAKFLQVNLSNSELESTNARKLNISNEGLVGKTLTHWGGIQAAIVSQEMQDFELEHGEGFSRQPEYKTLKRLYDRLSTVAAMDDTWVYSASEYGISFDCTCPARYNYLLFGGIQKVILLSATIIPFTLRLLGIPRAECKFKEWPRVFPKNRCPINYLPVKDSSGKVLKISREKEITDFPRIIRIVDQIIAGRLDRKGVIHTVSYSRARKVLEDSKYAKYMLFNDSGKETTDTLNKFRESEAPRVLISPSFSTGYDFKYEAAEYQIIIKIPFPVPNSLIMKEIRKVSPQYYDNSTMQELVQMCGRIMRAEDDRGETFILDGQFGWFRWAAKEHAPNWFHSLIRSLEIVPEPPPKLTPKKLLQRA